ncbi:unnamed protein product, partial [marine sediment metagenome]
VQIMGVSAVTIRQDLNHLEAEGFLKRVHGGAIFKSTDDISNRLGINYEKKLRIALKAAAFVHEGDTILIESGSANAILARELSKKDGINIVTSNVFIARELKKSKHTKVILLGGLYQHESESLVGKLTKLGMENINFSKSFIGVDGFTIESGFTSTDMMRAEIALSIVKKSKEVFIITDSSKFGRIELTNLFDVNDINYVITDDGIPEKDKLFLEKNGAKVIIA